MISTLNNTTTQRVGVQTKATVVRSEETSGDSIHLLDKTVKIKLNERF